MLNKEKRKGNAITEKLLFNSSKSILLQVSFAYFNYKGKYALILTTGEIFSTINTSAHIFPYGNSTFKLAHIYENINF